jgi:demethylspheroidene O-methyltransferase
VIGDPPMAAFSLPLRLSAGQIGTRFNTWRSRLIADARFQRWAAASPLTRRLARRKARALFDLCAGFVYSQILRACVQLEVFELLRGGPMDLAWLAARMRLTVPAARRLLSGAASLRLLRALPGDRFALDDLGAAVNGNPAIAAFIDHHDAFVDHHDLLYADLKDPVALLRGEIDTNLSRFWPYAGNRARARSKAEEPAESGWPPQSEEGRASAYSDLMSRTQPLVAEDILDAYPFARHRCLLDVGGGDGAFFAAAAKRAPHLALKLFDLPRVAARAQQRLDALGLSGRAEAIGGDMLRDRLPRGADVASLIRVLHDHDDESVRVILAAIRDALPPGGVLIVAEPMAGARGAEPMGEAYFGFYLLAMGGGRPRSASEIAAHLDEAGFRRVRRLKTPRPLLVSALLGVRV